ncbi:hypothetical protein LXL04_035195 [Taraxacum kok-saghyz]
MSTQRLCAWCICLFRSMTRRPKCKLGLTFRFATDRWRIVFVWMIGCGTIWPTLSFHKKVVIQQTKYDYYDLL